MPPAAKGVEPLWKPHVMGQVRIGDRKIDFHRLFLPLRPHPHRLPGLVGEQQIAVFPAVQVEVACQGHVLAAVFLYFGQFALFPPLQGLQAVRAFGRASVALARLSRDRR